jgi:ppGpp synthetase/RelA/SpoT-type nucleotidyltranferase
MAFEDRPVSLEDEINSHLSRFGPSYEKFLEDVLSDLYRFKDRSALGGAIYRIYSRADKQDGGRKLKTEAGIAKTIRRWRVEGSPNAKISELHDIIGVTVVTYFDSEVLRIVEALKKPDVYKSYFKSFEFVDTWRKPREDEKDNTGYFAHHVRIRSASGGFLKSLLCEIQVKSLLNDGWAAKTHDLVYKSKTIVDPEVKRQVEVIGGMVNGLEKLSDGLRALITRNLELDEKRRTAAISRLMGQTLDAVTKSDNPDTVEWYRTVVDKRDHLAICGDNDPELIALVDAWRDKIDGGKRSHTACRLILLLALFRQSSTAAWSTFEAIEDWVASIEEPEAKLKAMRFKATSHWVLKAHDEAIEISRKIIYEAKNHGLPLLTAKIDLAYYLAERCFMREGHCSPELAAEIEDLIDGWDEEPNERALMSRKDSIGAIRIMTATTADQAFSGQQLCQQAKEWAAANSPDADVFENFYKLHAERARRRIQELPPL